MKKLFLLVITCSTLALSFAENDGQQTKISQAVNTKNSLFKQEVFSVDNIPSFRIDAVRVTDVEKFTITAGLKAVYKIMVGKELKTYNNYIDADEIDGLITSLEYMKTVLKNKTVPGSYTELKFISRDGFQVMLYTIINDHNKLDWSFSVQPDIHMERSFLSLQNDDIDKLLKTLQQAKEKL